MTEKMLAQGDPSTHFWLARSVARAMGVNLSQAMSAGRLSPDGYTELVVNCCSCALVTQCQRWLATDAMPHYAALEECLIRETLERLQ